MMLKALNEIKKRSDRQFNSMWDIYPDMPGIIVNPSDMSFKIIISFMPSQVTHMIL
jgi:hypothetical protein